MGINMPAKTVVFTSVEKFDGEEFRLLRGGEYIQMSGRAGRRGLDDKGIVIMMVDKKLEPDGAKEIIQGKADPLNSEFRLSYNMLLNLQRIEDVEPKNIIQQSFRQFQNERSLPKLNKRRDELKAQKSQLKFDNKKQVYEYFNILNQVEELQKRAHDIIIKPQYSLPFLIPGRIVHVVEGPLDWGWGVVINFTKTRMEEGMKRDDKNITDKTKEFYIVDVNLYISTAGNEKRPALYEKKNGEFGIVPIELSLISEISTIQIKMTGEYKSKDKLNLMGETLVQILDKFNKKPTILDPVNDMEISEPDLLDAINKTKVLIIKLKQIEKPSEQEQQKYTLREQINKEIDNTTHSIELYKKMVMSKDLDNMQRVLRRLEYMDKNQILLKGKVACCIDASDELVATELILNGTFNNIDPTTAVALCSCLIFTESKSDSKKTVKATKLMQAYDLLTQAADRIAHVKQESNIDIDINEYVSSFKLDLMEVAYEWCKGAKFLDICKMTEVYEGTIIRCFRRLEELLEQIINASKTIGNSTMSDIFTEGAKSLKRDIVFASSLYL
jgi:ATP-dependent RNA helicase DOB1